MMKRVGFERKLRFESLEWRRMLAGNVTATLNGAGTLKIKGDDLSNDVAVIADTGTAGDFRVQDADGDGSTTINGAAPGIPATFTGVVNIEIDMKKGDDDVVVNDEDSHSTTLTGNLSVKTGEGIDSVTIGATDDDEITIGGKVKIETGKHADIVTVYDLNVSGNAEIETGDGDDEVTVDNRFVSATKSATGFEGELEVETGKGNDTVGLRDVAVTGVTEIETSDGSDSVFIDSSNDPQSIGGSTFTDLEIDLGDHDDVVAIGDLLGSDLGVVITGHLEIESGKGNDKVHLLDVTVDGSTEVETSDGHDCVEIRDSVFADLEVDLGKGDDDLLVADTETTGTVEFNGGKNSDTYFDDGGNIFALPAIFNNFEDLLGVAADFDCAFVPNNNNT